jgi:ligand-binding sensor domain-containing protein/two-component sensor histidine kinase
LKSRPKSSCILRAAAIAALCVPVFALDPRLSLTQYTHRVWLPQQGFTQATVQKVWQGPKGYIWLATQRGPVRFDGVRFTPAESMYPDLPQNLLVRTGTEDSHGGTWIGTSDAGVFYLKDHAVTHYSEKDGLPSDGIYCVIAAKEDQVWVCTARGLARIADGKVESFTKVPSAPPTAFSACETEDGSLWIGGNSPSLTVYRNSGFQTRSLKSLPSEFGVIALACSGETVWAGTTQGLVQVDGDQERLFREKDGLADSTVFSLATGSTGTLWIGTKGGFTRYRNGEFSSFASEQGLSQSSVFSLFEDREGSLWVGTKHGLNQFVDSPATPYTTNEGLPSNNVGPVMEDSRGEVWVGTLDAGLSHLAGKRFISVTRAQGLTSNHVRALADDFKGSLWVGTDDGLNLLRDSRVTAAYTTAQGLPSNSVQALYRTLAGTMWVGTTAGPAWFSDGRFLVPAGAPHEPVLAIGEDAQGRPVFSTARGVFIVSAGAAKPFEPSGSPFRSVDVFYLDPDGLLWLGATDGQGLRLVDGDEVTSYGTREGMFDNVIYGIVRDDGDRLWMSCSKGIFSVPRQELRKLAIGDLRRVTSTPFVPTDGQRVIEGRAAVGPGAWTMGDGHLWFSTIRGLLVVDTGRRRDLPPPQVSIEDPVVNGQLQQPDSIFGLGPGQKNIEFHYTGLSFIAPGATTFRYKLEGYDKDWIEAGDRRDAFYTNLPPSKYRFLVVACAPDGRCGQDPGVMAFALASNYYQRAWFFPLLALLAGVGVWLGYWFRVRQLRTKYDLIVNERSRIARELHDTLIQGFSGVTMALQAFTSRLSSDQDKESMEDIIQDAAACLTETRRTVAGLRSGGGEESGLAAAIADTARQITETKDIHLRLKMEDVPARLSADVEYNLLRIAAEALANSVKHSGAHNIDVVLQKARGAIRLEVRDDGIGFVNKNGGFTSEGHYGLVGMKERAVQIGAELEVSSAPGRGTSVSVVLPLERRVEAFS